MSECVYPQDLRMNWQGLNSEEEAEKGRKNTAKNPRHHHKCQHHGAREGCTVFQVRTARSKTASRSIDWALFSIQTEWRRNAIRIRVCRNEENVGNSYTITKVLTQSTYPLSNQALHPRKKASPEKSNSRTHKQKTARYKTTEIMHQISRANSASAKYRTNF